MTYYRYLCRSFPLELSPKHAISVYSRSNRTINHKLCTFPPNMDLRGQSVSCSVYKSFFATNVFTTTKRWLNKGISTQENEVSSPIVTFYRLYDVVFNKVGLSHKVSYERIKKGTEVSWMCTIDVTWPSERKAVGYAESKRDACKIATADILSWLQDCGKITPDGWPILIDPVRTDPKIQFKLEDSDSFLLADLISSYKKSDVQRIILEKLDSYSASAEDTEEGETLARCTSPVLGTSLLDALSFSDLTISRRNNFLQSRAMKKQLSRKGTRNSHVLPIEDYREDIMDLINRNRVVVIAGETGCGKSTQIPSFIFDEWAMRNKGTDCNILVTQPRRLAATSLAQRVAFEYSEDEGLVVGHRVRFSHKFPQAPGGILYTTSGMLLIQFRNNPGLLGCSHVVVDEAHERDMNTDLMLLLLKKAMTLNPNLHVIIMSATLNPEIFCRYFNDAPKMHIPGHVYPVKSIFLPDSAFPRGNDKESKNINHREIAKFILHIHNTKPEGTILCFMPGWSDITAVENCLKDEETLHVLPLHSRISNENQVLVFERAPLGKRKVVLSTNIAESSITINDVVYIIETGLQKQQKWLEESNSVCFDVEWISQANVSQRKGRAGRTSPGECYHLYSKSMLKSFPVFPVPEIKKTPLDKLVLDCKNLSKESPEDFLSKLIEPPSDEAIRKAIDELISLKALDEDKNLTALGERMSYFTMHPRLSKALIHSALLRCVTPILNIVTVLSSGKVMFLLTTTRQQHLKVKKNYSLSSDHIAYHKIFQESMEMRSNNCLEEFCNSSGLSENSLDNLYSIKQIYYESLCDSGLLDQKKSLDYYNLVPENDELVKAVFMSGVGNLMKHKTFVKNSHRKESTFISNNYFITIGKDSVNEKYDGIPSPFLTYHTSAFHAGAKRTMIAYECSIVSLLSIILFQPSEIIVKRARNNTSMELIFPAVDANIKCSGRDGELLIRVRHIITDILKYLVIEEGRATDEENFKTVSDFRDSLCLALSDLFLKEGDKIDSHLSEKNS